MYFKQLNTTEAYVTLLALGAIKNKEELSPDLVANAGEFGMEIINTVINEKETKETSELKRWSVG